MLGYDHVKVKVMALAGLVVSKCRDATLIPALSSLDTA